MAKVHNLLLNMSEVKGKKNVVHPVPEVTAVTLLLLLLLLLLSSTPLFFHHLASAVRLTSTRDLEA